MLRTRRVCASLLFLVTSLGACSGGGGDLRLSIVSSPDTEALLGSAYAYAVSVSGAGASAVSYALTNAPSGMSIDAAGVVTWAPEYGDIGQHPIRLEASTSEHSVAQSWTLRVAQGVQLGVTLSPRRHTSSSSADDYIDHYTNREHGRVIAFHSRWRDSVQSAGEFPRVAEVGAVAADQYGFVPAIGLGWSDGEGEPDLTSTSEPANNSWSNSETRAEFLQLVTDFAILFQPPYLFLGNETNSYYLTHTDPEWDDWISVFEQCYDAIKAVSPDTVVYTTFTYERLKGVGGAHTGWNDPPHWNVVDDHVQSGKIDALGFTTYAYLEYDAPTQIPLSYYEEIGQHWSGPVVFSEIGWLAADSVGLKGSEIEQANYIDAFFRRTSMLDLEYVAWLFLHDWDDQATVPAFANSGLRNNDASTVRMADAKWQSAVQLRQ